MPNFLIENYVIKRSQNHKISFLPLENKFKFLTFFFRKQKSCLQF